MIGSRVRAGWLATGLCLALMACGGSSGAESAPSNDDDAAGGEALGEDSTTETIHSDEMGESGGDGGGEAGGNMVAWQSELDDLSSMLGGSDEELDTALASTNCPEARGLKDRVCELARRICAISEEHPEHAPTRTRCEDAYERCDAAENRYGSVCDE